MKHNHSLWRKIGSGENNVVYKSLKKYKGITYVLKIPIDHNDLSEPARVTRKWNLANPDLLAIALEGPQIYWNIEDDVSKNADIPSNSIYLYCKTDKLKAIIKSSDGAIKRRDLSHLPDAQAIIQLIEDDASYSCLSLKQEHQIRRALNQPYRGVLAPHVDGTYNISEEEKAQALIQLYATTRQIVLDYGGEGNLILDAKTGRVRCVDFDEAISCDSPRSRSFFFNQDAHQAFRSSYLTTDKIELGEQVNLSLLYLEKHLKDYIFPLEILNKYMTAEIIFALNAFERESIPLTIRTLDILFFLTNAYPSHKLHLSAKSIHALEVNTDTFTAIEEICNELNERLFIEPEKQYLTLIEPDQLVSFIAAKRITASP